MSDLESIYRHRYADFLRVATAILGDEEPARDVVQEAFARALAHRRTFRGSGSLDGWVWRIVVNQARAARAKPSAGSNVVDSWASSANGDDLDARSVRVWIAGLPDRQRLVVFLRHYAELDYQTIADVMGIKRGTVSATLHAAHARLRRVLEEVAS